MKPAKTTKPHHGQNIRRLRDFRGLKQIELAERMGADYDQTKVSTMEGKEQLDDETLAKAAEALGVTPDVIQTLDPDKGNYFNTFNGPNNVGFGSESSFTLNFNPIDTIRDLYERLVESEKEKSSLLQQQLKLEKEKNEGKS